MNAHPPTATGMAVPTAIAIAGLAFAVGCSGSGESPPGDLVIEREMVDGVELVTVVSGSRWEEPIAATEELSIGAFDGPEEYTFGFITELTPDGSGGVYVFDGNVPALRHYDAEGEFVRTLGGEGEGPGEYGDAVLGLEIRSDGRLVARDARNARLSIYDPDGTFYDSRPIASGLFSSDAMRVTNDDHIYLRILTGPIEENAPWPLGLLHLDPEGTVLDTIPPPTVADPPDFRNGVFSPEIEWTLAYDGSMIVGASDRYEFEIRRPDGTVTRVRRAWEPVAVLSEEKEQRQAVLDWQWERQGQFMTAEFDPVPDEKPAYAGLHAGLDGTIWVRRHVEAEFSPFTGERDPERPPPVEWREPTVFDVFESDGTYLGEVRIPPRTSVQVFARDVLWGTRRGEFDEQYVVRLRVEGATERLESAESLESGA